MKLTNLQKDLEGTLSNYHIAGASIAVFNQGELATASAGITNINTGVEITNDTLMHIGSIAKIFTTALIMQLVDKKQINLEAPVLQYLPELKLKDMGALESITVKMLLNHTSGIDASMLPTLDHDKETIENAVARFAEVGQIHVPGDDYSYCNGAMVIAGYLAQRVTGKSWYDLIKENIYTPLNVQHAVTLPEEALLHSTSVGHYFDSKTNAQVSSSFSLQPMGFSPGGTTLMMSASDLVTFARAHITNGIGSNGLRILSESSAKSMRQPTLVCGKRGPVNSIGLGWMIFDKGIVGHGGGAPGVVSMLVVCPDKDFAAAILTNSSHGMALIDHFMGPWLEEVADSTSLYAVSPVTFPSLEDKRLDIHRFVGTYESITERYRISVMSRGLGVSRQLKFKIYDGDTVEPTTVVPLIPLGNDEFIVKLPEGQLHKSLMALDLKVLTFKNPDSKGRMQNLGISGRYLYPQLMTKRLTSTQ